MELRKARRYQLSASVFFWWENSNGVLQEGRGTTRDISATSAFVVTHTLPPTGVQLQVDVHLSSVEAGSKGAQLHGEGKVIRVERRNIHNEGFAAEVVFQAESSDEATILESGKPQ